MAVLVQTVCPARAPSALFWYSARAHRFLHLHDGIPSQLAMVLAASVRGVDSAFCALCDEA